MDVQLSLFNDLQKIRAESPIVLNLTNQVAMDLNANALLALGASPIMAHAVEELSELVALASATVINIGTLDSAFIQSADFAIDECTKLKKPLVFDPVGAGASRLRSELGRHYANAGKFTAIRGNASEMGVLFGEEVRTRGVDASQSSESVILVMARASLKTSSVLVVSGETDFIFHQGKTVSVRNGDPLLTRVTAMGCTATSLMGAFMGINPSPFEAAIHTMALMGVVGEKARKISNGPGSFRTAFLDCLFSLELSDLRSLKVDAL